MIIVKVGLGKHNLPKQNKPSRPPIPLFCYEAYVIGERHIILCYKCTQIEQLSLNDNWFGHFRSIWNDAFVKTHLAFSKATSW